MNNNKMEQQTIFLKEAYPDVLITISMDELFESIVLIGEKEFPITLLNKLKIRGYVKSWVGKGYRLTEKGKSYVERSSKKATD
ncbi:hypothetical protein HOG98_06855 [bacterium]|jgi:hypothetical protein|nr:hypothetical protein [bacterium]